MVHELAESQLKRVFGLFFTPAMVGVNVIEGDEGEYGIYLMYPEEGLDKETQMFDYMNEFDPDWVIWLDKDKKWGATVYIADINPELCAEKEYVFNTHNFNKALKQLFELFTEEFFDDMKKETNEYMKYD